MATPYHKGIAARYRTGLETMRTSAPESEISYLRQRSVWLTQNDGYAAAAQKKLIAHQIGTGIKGYFTDSKLQARWKAFCASPVEGTNDTFYSLQALIASEMFHGESFIRIHHSGRSEIELPFHLSVINSGLCPTKSVMVGEQSSGIVRTKAGKVKTYKFLNRFEKSMFFSSDDLKVVSVSAKKIVHAFEPKTAGETRGFPVLTPIMLPLLDLNELTSATIMRQKAAQAVGWVVTKESELDKFTRLGELAPSLASDVNMAMPATTEKAGAPVEEIVPGGVHYLRKGEKIDFAEPSDIGSNLLVMLRYQLRKVSSAVGLLYEMLSGDISQVNYSSIRSGITDINARLEQYQRLVLITKAFSPIADKFKTFCELWYDETYEDGMHWILPKKMSVDPWKDVKADKEEISGEMPLSTWREKVESRDVDFETFLTQIEKEGQHVRKTAD